MNAQKKTADIYKDSSIRYPNDFEYKYHAKNVNQEAIDRRIGQAQ